MIRQELLVSLFFFNGSLFVSSRKRKAGLDARPERNTSHDQLCPDPPRAALERLLHVFPERSPAATQGPALPLQEIEGLSDSLLEDIGVDPRSVPRPSYTQAVSLGLSERGWVPPRPAHRR